MFFSRALNVAQEKYSQTEKEGLALVMAVKVFHRYLEGRRFTLLTDHRALLSIFGPKKQKPSYAVNRLHRWSLFLAAYNFDILYKKTTEFGQADALSRLIADTRQIKDQFEEEEEIDETSHAARVVQAINLLPVSADDIKVAYENDQFAQDIFKELQSSNPKDAGRFSNFFDLEFCNNSILVMLVFPEPKLLLDNIVIGQE
uniref:Reverse transcriptase RNase H-like domain-containing protein n=1 Tax=Panagrolaimus superbus TaxID=310955 RepID=A0A914YPI5_9BILA